jgi:hypothetical protein
MNTLLIPWIKSTNNVHKETIKWSHGNAKHEICTPVLGDLELKALMPHCLAVKSKIEQVVTVDAHLGHHSFECSQEPFQQSLEPCGTSSLLVKTRKNLSKALKQAFAASLMLLTLPLKINRSFHLTALSSTGASRNQRSIILLSLARSEWSCQMNARGMNRILMKDE